MDWIEHDGGRAAAGFRGRAGDCVTRAVAIAAGLPYGVVYAALAQGRASQRRSPGRAVGYAKSAAHGVNTSRQWFKEYMATLGFAWTPTMAVGAGCRVHLRANELPSGRLIVSLSRHYSAVVDGVIYDTFDPRRGGDRCVYGFWKMER